MERTTKIIIGVSIISILCLGILGVVYYYLSKKSVDNLSLKSKKQNSVTVNSENPPVIAPKPKSVVTFEEIQEEEPVPENEVEQKIEEQTVEHEPREVTPEPVQSYYDQSTENEYYKNTHPPTQMTPQNYEQSYFQEPPKKNASYASVGVDYGSSNLDFQFSRKPVEEDEY